MYCSLKQKSLFYFLSTPVCEHAWGLCTPWYHQDLQCIPQLLLLPAKMFSLKIPPTPSMLHLKNFTPAVKSFGSVVCSQMEFYFLGNTHSNTIVTTLKILVPQTDSASQSPNWSISQLWRSLGTGQTGLKHWNKCSPSIHKMTSWLQHGPTSHLRVCYVECVWARPSTTILTLAIQTTWWTSLAAQTTMEKQAKILILTVATTKIMDFQDLWMDHQFLVKLSSHRNKVCHFHAHKEPLTLNPA